MDVIDMTISEAVAMDVLTNRPDAWTMILLKQGIEAQFWFQCATNKRVAQDNFQSAHPKNRISIVSAAKW
jgi:hypothetical protein